MPLRLDLEGAVAVIRYIESSPLLAGNRLVGSGTGAVIRRRLLGCVRGFPLRARVGVAVIPSPVPAASHAACGFAALRAPAPLRGKSQWNDRLQFAARGLRCELEALHNAEPHAKEPVMSNVRFIGLDVHAETIAVAVAEPDGEVRSLGIIPNRSASIGKLVKRLGAPAQLRV